MKRGYALVIGCLGEHHALVIGHAHNDALLAGKVALNFDLHRSCEVFIGLGDAVSTGCCDAAHERERYRDEAVVI